MNTSAQLTDEELREILAQELTRDGFKPLVPFAEMLRDPSFYVGKRKYPAQPRLPVLVERAIIAMREVERRTRDGARPALAELNAPGYRDSLHIISSDPALSEALAATDPSGCVPDHGTLGADLSPGPMAVTATPRAPIEHELKTWESYFHGIADGSKPFEIRRDDRGFRIGDTLWLRETRYGSGEYTGREARRTISYILRHEEDLGLSSGFAILGLAPASPSPAAEIDEIRKRHEAGDAESGWVIEYGKSPVCEPEYWIGNGWSKDNLRAIRFCREVDAQNTVNGWDEDDWLPGDVPHRIAEHGWG